MAVTMALFTRDLRVHDNPVLVAAAKNGNAVLPVFPRSVGNSSRSVPVASAGRGRN